MWRRSAIGVAMMLAACSNGEARTTTDDGRPIGARVDVGTSVTSPTERSVEDDVLEAVNGFVQSTITVNDPPDPEHVDLGRYRAGAVLDHAVAAVAQNRALGVAYRLPTPSSSTHRAQVEWVDGERAVVQDCVVDDAQQIGIVDGRVLNAAVATKLFRTTVARVGLQWKVVENVLLQRWEGVAGCA